MSSLPLVIQVYLIGAVVVAIITFVVILVKEDSPIEGALAGALFGVLWPLFLVVLPALIVFGIVAGRDIKDLFSDGPSNYGGRC